MPQERHKTRGWATGEAMVALIGIAVLLLITFWVGVTDPVRAEKAIRDLGLEPVSVGGYAFFACGEGDWYQTKFTARRPDGKTVSGAVCAGLLFKGQTVRFD